LFHALAHFEQIAKAGGGEQSDLSAFAFNECIRGYRRAVDEQFRARQQLLRRAIVRRGDFAQASEYALRWIAWRRVGLEIARRFIATHDHEIRECATDINADFKHVSLLFALVS